MVLRAAEVDTQSDSDGDLSLLGDNRENCTDNSMDEGRGRMEQADRFGVVMPGAPDPMARWTRASRGSSNSSNNSRRSPGGFSLPCVMVIVLVLVLAGVGGGVLWYFLSSDKADKPPDKPLQGGDGGGTAGGGKAEVLDASADANKNPSLRGASDEQASRELPETDDKQAISDGVKSDPIEVSSNGGGPVPTNGKPLFTPAGPRESAEQESAEQESAEQPKPEKPKLEESKPEPGVPNPEVPGTGAQAAEPEKGRLERMEDKVQRFLNISKSVGKVIVIFLVVLMVCGCFYMFCQVFLFFMECCSLLDTAVISCLTSWTLFHKTFQAFVVLADKTIGSLSKCCSSKNGCVEKLENMLKSVEEKSIKELLKRLGLTKDKDGNLFAGDTKVSLDENNEASLTWDKLWDMLTTDLKFDDIMRDFDSLDAMGVVNWALARLAKLNTDGS